MVAFQDNLKPQPTQQVPTMMMTPNDVINLKELIKNDNGDMFVYRGVPLLKSYAKYLVEFLENKFKEKND